MPAAATRDLEHTKSYCTERLKDIQLELGRLREEGPPLKAELDTNPDRKRVAAIRRRRTYLKMRTDELKAERVVVTGKLEKTREQLKPLIAERKAARTKTRLE